VGVYDVSRTWGSNKAVLARNGQTLASLSEDMDLDITGVGLIFAFDASRGWQIAL
jgi:hypothetical protein